MLKIGELIGRRREMRQIIRVLTDDPRAIATTGRKAGCQILGTGGVGKSAIAGRILQRMADRGWRIATLGGSWNLASLARNRRRPLGPPQKDAANLARQLERPRSARPRSASSGCRPPSRISTSSWSSTTSKTC